MMLVLARGLLLALGAGSVALAGENRDCAASHAAEKCDDFAAIEEEDEAPFLQKMHKDHKHLQVMADMGRASASLPLQPANVTLTKDLPSTTLLRHVKFLTTHDSATGYLNPGLSHFEDIFLVDYLKTQDYDLTGQLDCGARALDLRIGKKASNAPVSLHHAQFFIPNTDVQTTVLPQLTQWAADNPTELVILLVGHCYLAKNSMACDSSYYEPFTNAGIQVHTDSTKIQGMTLGEARSLAALPGGGMILALGGEPVGSAFQQWPGQNCGTVTIYGDFTGVHDACSAVKDKIDSSIDCSSICTSLVPQLTLSCDDACWTEGYPLNTYVNNAMKTAQDANTLGMVQAFWQETAGQIASFGGVPCTSSEDNSSCYSVLDVSWKSGLNRHVASMAQSGSFGIGNFIEVNQVNNYGPIIAAALGSATIPPNTCPQALWQEKLCEQDSDCPLGRCARPTAATNGLVCCPSGHSDSHDLIEYCTEMPDGTLCYESETCKSGWCNGGDDDGRMGHCQKQLPTGSPCDVNSACQSSECGAIPNDGSYTGWPPTTVNVCCGVDFDTHSYDGTQYCQGMPDGTLCIEDENCNGGWCNGGDTEDNRMGHCQAKGGTGFPCDVNSACTSSECGAIPNDASYTGWPPTTTNVCCGVDFDTHSYDGTQYCQGMPDGTLCIKNENCNGGWCNGGDTEDNRMGHCQAQLPDDSGCDVDAACQSGNCYQGFWGDDPGQCQ